MTGALIERVLIEPLPALSYAYWLAASVLTVVWILLASGRPASPTQLVISRVILHAYGYVVIPLTIIALTVFFVLSVPDEGIQFLRYSAVEVQLALGTVLSRTIVRRIKPYSPRYLFGFTFPAGTALLALLAISLSLIAQALVTPASGGPIALSASVLVPALGVSVLLRSVLILLLAYGTLWVRTKLRVIRGQ